MRKLSIRRPIFVGSGVKLSRQYPIIVNKRRVEEMAWETSYRLGMTPWLRRAANPAFEHWFSNQELRGTNVLIPGCGTSVEPALFASRGAVVTCIDLAPAAISEQQKTFKRLGYTGRFIVGDLFSWRGAQSFDFAYEQTCLCAIDPAQRLDYEVAIHGALRSEGALYALFMQTARSGGPPFHCDIEAMRHLFAPDRWDWPSDVPCRSEHPIGVYELGVVLKRRGSVGSFL